MTPASWTFIFRRLLPSNLALSHPTAAVDDSCSSYHGHSLRTWNCVVQLPLSTTPAPSTLLTCSSHRPSVSAAATGTLNSVPLRDFPVVHVVDVDRTASLCLLTYYIRFPFLALYDCWMCLFFITSCLVVCNLKFQAYPQNYFMMTASLHFTFHYFRMSFNNDGFTVSFNDNCILTA